MNIKDRIINGVRLGDVEKGPVTEMKELLMQANAEGTALLENNGMLPLKTVKKLRFSEGVSLNTIKAAPVREER